MRKPRRESPARTRRKRVHQANMCFSLFCTVSMCEVRRCFVFQALQNLCRYLLDDTERLDSMARVVGPQVCGQGNAVVLWGLESTWQTATLRVFPRQNRIVCLQFSFVFRARPRRRSPVPFAKSSGCPAAQHATQFPGPWQFQWLDSQSTIFIYAGRPTEGRLISGNFCWVLAEWKRKQKDVPQSEFQHNFGAFLELCLGLLYVCCSNAGECRSREDLWCQCSLCCNSACSIWSLVKDLGGLANVCCSRPETAA